MTPDEHYREAERLLAAVPSAIDKAMEWARGPDLDDETITAGQVRSDFLIDVMVARAHVHATLATLGTREGK